MKTPRPLVFTLLLFVCNWEVGRHFVDAARVNVTVDDTDASILYLPAGSWHASSVPCPQCLNPGASVLSEVWQQTWHDGTHIVPTSDDDDFPSSASSPTPTAASRKPTPPSPSPTHPPAPPAPPPTPPTPSPSPTGGHDDDDGDDGDDADEKGKGGHGKRQLGVHRKRDLDNPFQTSKFDSDDPQFVDTPVTVQFNFTGTAIYLYGILPLGLAPANSTPTYVNLSFSVDHTTVGAYIHSGSSSASGFTPGVLMFAQEDLTDSAHELQVDVGDDSVFLFDYLVFTESVPSDSPATSTTAPPAQLTASGQPATSAAEKKHNIATFGGAVGGSFGVLSVFAFGLAFNIYRRRQKAAQRDRRERDALHTNDAEDSPPMQGPAPFVPRYFPGTVPAAPPPYIPRSSISSPSAAPYTPLLNSPEPYSYADRPPATPPPVDDAPLGAPPPFFVAISTPAPVLLSSVLTPPASAPAVQQLVSHELESELGSEESQSSSSISLPPPLAPRPRSRASSTSLGASSDTRSDTSGELHGT